MAEKKKNISFEAALQQLEKLTEEIERGEIGLEESIAKYEKGMTLVARCREILNKAELRIQELSAAPENEPAPASESSDATSDA